MHIPRRPSRSLALLLLTLFSVDRSDFYKVKTIVVVVVSASHNHFCFVNIRSVNRKRVSVAAMQLNGSACEVCAQNGTKLSALENGNVVSHRYESAFFLTNSRMSYFLADFYIEKSVHAIPNI